MTLGEDFLVVVHLLYVSMHSWVCLNQAQRVTIMQWFVDGMCFLGFVDLLLQ